MATEATRTRSPAAALMIVAGAAGIVIGVWSGAIDPHIRIGELNVHHWFAWAGALFIAAFTAAFYVLIRQRTPHRRVLTLVHVYGGLIAFSAVSFHFARHGARLDIIEPGTGIVLYAAVLLSVITGFLMQFRLLSAGAREWRLLHDGAAVTFYLAIVVHLVVRLGLV